MKPSTINWLFYAPQFHIGISIIAVICLGINIKCLRLIRKIAKKVGLND